MRFSGAPDVNLPYMATRRFRSIQYHTGVPDTTWLGSRLSVRLPVPRARVPFCLWTVRTPSTEFRRATARTSKLQSPRIFNQRLHYYLHYRRPRSHDISTRVRPARCGLDLGIPTSTSRSPCDPGHTHSHRLAPTVLYHQHHIIAHGSAKA